MADEKIESVWVCDKCLEIAMHWNSELEKVPIQTEEEFIAWWFAHKPYCKNNSGVIKIEKL